MTSTVSSDEIEIWGDVRCPWCWIDSRHLYTAAAAAGIDGSIRHRGFLLEPSGPEGGRTVVLQAAVTSWGMTEAEWWARSRRIRHGGEEVGVEINIDSARQVDSRDAHRLLKLAVDRGVDARAAWDQVFDAHLRKREVVVRGVRSVPTVFRGSRSVSSAASADEFLDLMRTSAEHGR